MRLILGAAAILLIGGLAACGGGGGDESTKTASPTPKRYVACDLLTKGQRETAVGAKVDVQGRPDNDLPTWTCAFGNTPEPSARNQVVYRAMRAHVWAEKVPDIIVRPPADAGSKKLLVEVLNRAGVSEGELSSIDDDVACDLWRVLQETVAATVVGDTTSGSETVDELDVELARASTCSQGIYADILVAGPDADSSGGRDRAEKALSTIYTNAAKHLPH